MPQASSTLKQRIRKMTAIRSQAMTPQTHNCWLLSHYRFQKSRLQSRPYLRSCPLLVPRKPRPPVKHMQTLARSGLAFCTSRLPNPYPYRNARAPTTVLTRTRTQPRRPLPCLQFLIKRPRLAAAVAFGARLLADRLMEHRDTRRRRRA